MITLAAGRSAGPSKGGWPMPADRLRPRPLGSSGMEVSAMSLGSWRTFERLPRESGSAILAAARDEGINFFDDARYNDETGRAPLPTGYSEVLFGELFRGAGVRRGEVVVANKLWWEFWPDQSAAAELDASLARMGFEYVDVIYANPPPGGLAIADMVAAVGGLLGSGKARAWAMVNWQAGPCGEAVAAAASLGVAPPCAVQLPYSLVRRSWVEDAEMTRALHAAGAGVVASFCLEGGVLSGKYLSGGAAGPPRPLMTPGWPRQSPWRASWPASPPSWAPPLPRSRWPSRSPTATSPACCSGRPARSSYGPTARRPACWTG